MKSPEIETIPVEVLNVQRSPQVGRSSSESSVVIHKERSESTEELASDSEHQHSGSSFGDEIPTPSVEGKAEVTPVTPSENATTPLRKWRLSKSNFKTAEDISTFYSKQKTTTPSEAPKDVAPPSETVETFDKVLVSMITRDSDIRSGLLGDNRSCSKTETD